MTGSWFFLLLSGLLLQHSYTQSTTVCPDLRYQLRGPDNRFCYQYYDITEDYSAANRSCVRDGGTLLYIDDASEDDYIYQTYFLARGRAEFWIGLNDLNKEGVFRWENSSLGSEPMYLNWTGGAPAGNDINKDCVTFTATGWQVHDGFCSTSFMPHVCKMISCQSNDGRVCIGSEQVTESSAVSPVVIIIPVILIIVLLLLVGVVLVLLCIWKCSRESLMRYLCCCVSGGSKGAIHGMQQENQRLRHELSQHKVSLSGRFQPGQLLSEERELSGVPDGRGGVLPTIKQPITPGTLAPLTTDLGRTNLASMEGQRAGLPRLVLQQPSNVQQGFNRQSSQPSLFFHGNTSVVRPVRQSLPGISTNPLALPQQPSVPAPIRKTGESITAHTKLEEMSESESSDSEHDRVSPIKKDA